MNSFDILLINEAIPAAAEAAKVQVGKLLDQGWIINRVLVAGEKPPVFAVVMVKSDVSQVTDGFVTSFAEG